MNDFSKHKQKTEKEIVDCMVAALRKETLKEEDLPLIGRFVLDHIDNVENHTELVSFLNQLSAKWPVFSPLKQIEEGEMQELEDDEVAEGVLALLKHGKIDNALSLAKQQNNK